MATSEQLTVFDARLKHLRDLHDQSLHDANTPIDTESFMLRTIVVCKALTQLAISAMPLIDPYEVVVSRDYEPLITRQLRSPYLGQLFRLPAAAAEKPFRHMGESQVYLGHVMFLLPRPEAPPIVLGLRRVTPDDKGQTHDITAISEYIPSEGDSGAGSPSKELTEKHLAVVRTSGDMVLALETGARIWGLRSGADSGYNRAFYTPLMDAAGKVLDGFDASRTGIGTPELPTS